MRCNQRHLLIPTSGGWRSSSKHRIIVFTWEPRQKGSAIEVGGKVRGGSAVTEEVYNPWRFRLCGGNEEASYVFRARTKTTKCQITASCIRVSWGRANARQGPFLKNGHHRDAICWKLVLFLRQRAINTGIICILLNSSWTRFMKLDRPAEKWLAFLSMRSTCTPTRGDRPEWHVRVGVSYIPKNISVGARYLYTPAKTRCVIRKALKYVIRLR